MTLATCVTLIVDHGGEVEVRLFDRWIKGLRAFKATVTEYEKEPDVLLDVEHVRGHWWANSLTVRAVPWIELKKIKVE